MHIYIYIYRERERERERACIYIYICLHMDNCVYIYMDIHQRDPVHAHARRQAEQSEAEASTQVPSNVFKTGNWECTVGVKHVRAKISNAQYL